MKYALFDSSVIVFFFVPIAEVRDLPMLSKDTNIMIGETFMHFRACLFDYNHSLHYLCLYPVFILLLFYILPSAPDVFGLFDTVIIYK